MGQPKNSLMTELYPNQNQDKLSPRTLQVY